MKKFLAIIAIASFAVACNGSGDSKTTTDTTTAPVDTTTPAVVDTTKPAVVDTTKPAATDTTAKH